jgi:RES domain-containing protein
MHVYRLARKKYPDVLSGVGAARKGARWNSAGTEIIYTAANRSLAMAEVAVHFSMADLPSDFLMYQIHIPDDVSIKVLQSMDLPARWNYFPNDTITQKFGDLFIRENVHCILKVPSVVTIGDFNLLINPQHPEFKKAKIVDSIKFPFDNRIFT